LRSEDLAAGGDVGYGVEDRLFYQGAAPFKARRRLEMSVVSGLSFRSTGSGNLREIIKKLRVVLETYFR
jgi:hypothetical protein